MKTLCINIDSDTESWALAQKEFDRVGLTVERVSAIVEDNRPLAFNKSVYKCMEMARGDSLLLFEDDVVFDKHNVLDLIGDGLHNMEALSFMTLHLGCNIIGMSGTEWQMPTAHGNGIVKLHNCWQSHATLYSADCVQFILDNLRTDVLDADNNIFDDWLRRKVLPMGRSYILNPMIAYQRPRKSEIWNTHADYTGAHIQGNEWLKRNL